MAISSKQARDQKRFEQPAWDYCLRLAQEMKVFTRKLRLAEFRAEVVVEQTDVLTSALQEAWSKSFHDPDRPKGIDEASEQEIANRLHAQPRVQARMATLVEYPPSKWLLEQELTARGHWDPDHPLEDVYILAESLNLKGVCFSGGGIRSATFNLGVLQGLAALDKLGSFDYLSTVSGGGYIHQFLASWISRDRLNKVERLLQPLSSKHAERTFWPEPLRWLMRYSGYLSPQLSVFATDSWVAFAIWLRNALLNQIVLLATILFVLALPHWRLEHAGRMATELILHGGNVGIFIFTCFTISAVSIWSQNPPERTRRTRGLKQMAILSLVLLPLVIGSFALSPYLFRSAFWRGNVEMTGGLVPCSAQFLGSSPAGSGTAVPSTIDYIRHLHLLGHPSPLVRSSDGACVRSPEETILADKSIFRTSGINDLLQWWSAYSFRWWSPIERFNEEPSTSWVFVSLLAGIGLLILAASRALPSDWRALILLVAIPGAMAAAYVFVGLSRLFVFISSFFLPIEEITRFNIAILPPITLAIIFVSVEIGKSVLGNLADESAREFLARLRIWGFIFGIVWFSWIAASLIGPRIAFDVFNLARFGKPLALGWIGTTLAAVIAGKTSFSPADKDSLPRQLLRILALAGPPIFILGLTFSVAAILYALGNSVGQQSTPHAEFFGLLLGLTLAAATLTRLIDINEFSLHAYYRDRLARSYVGASDPYRQPSYFTGFAAGDKRLRLVDLLPAAFSKASDDLLPYDGAKDPKLPTYQGPFPIFCTTLNLSFGEDLAYQERKCAAFAFTPLYCGYDVGWTVADDNRVQFNGYTPTLNYAFSNGGPRVATAVAASGAANSPDRGHHSGSGMSFLLAIFALRLGLWIRNPRCKRFLLPRLNANPSSPAFGLFYLFAELFGMGNDEAAFVYLTDGGHFENMGLYELVRRHCMTIVICDAELDSDFSFQGLAGAISKCRVDFGVEINLELSSLRPTEESATSKAHSVEGTIRYPSGATGRVLYVKTTITNELPIELINYHQEHPEFPSNLTNSREFSEFQFESYRRLGQASILTYPADQWLKSNLP